MGALLELRNIETYYGPVMAIKGVSLEVREGQIVSLLGANGAGKTTVLKTVSGAMDPQKGTVSLGGSTTMLDRVQQLGIDTGKAGQPLRIQLVVLVSAAVDQTDVSGIGRDRFVSELLQQALDPRRVGPDLDHHSRCRPIAEQFAKRTASRGDRVLL